MGDSNIWPVVAALGQWACAIATFWAVRVALKPYKRGFKVWLDSLTIKVGEESQCFPVCIKIKNAGYGDAEVKKVGISEDKFHTILFEEAFTVEGEGIHTLAIGISDIKSAFYSRETEKFQIFIEDSKGNEYVSKVYKKRQFKENKDIMEMYK